MNKNIIITGASRGLGKEIALNFAQKDDTTSLALIARTASKLADLQETIKKTNNKINVCPICQDLSDSEGISNAINSLKKTGVDFNILINNAGTYVLGSEEKVKDQEIEKVIFVNLIAPLRFSRFLLPNARENKWGRIVNISSISVFRPSPAIASYVMSKSALLSLSECITLSDMSNGITSNSILPGLMLTEMGKYTIKEVFTEYNEKNSEEIEKTVALKFPSKDLTKISDVINVINFLVSNEGGCISGEFFRVASGLL